MVMSATVNLFYSCAEEKKKDVITHDEERKVRDSNREEQREQKYSESSLDDGEEILNLEFLSMKNTWIEVKKNTIGLFKGQ